MAHIDEFITELEQVCGCSGMGYVKCLERVKELKQSNRMLFMENDHLQDLVGKDVKELDKKYKSLYVEHMKAIKASRDLTKDIEKLKKWSLSNTMIERTSAESIEEFEQDVIDNWTEIEELKEQIYELKEELKISSEQARVYGDKLLKVEEQVEELKEQVERCEEETIPKEFLTDYLEQAGLVAIDDSLLEKFEGYKTELDKLKKQNKYLELNLKNQDNINAQHSADISEEKKYSTEQRKRADKYMEELEELKEELEWGNNLVKLNEKLRQELNIASQKQ